MRIGRSSPFTNLRGKNHGPDLVGVYGESRINPSLGTADYRTAVLKATLTRAVWVAEFDAKRAESNPTFLASIPKELAEVLAKQVRMTEGEGQSLKTEASHRLLPIHSTLIRLGFLDYVERCRQAEETSLWPLLPLREGKPSDYFGGWFSKHRKALGLMGSYPDFHSFRRTVRAPMRRAGFSEVTQDKVTGHKVKG